jgi:hypothetical protein
LDLNELKNEDHENQADNHPMLVERQFEITSFPKKDKSDEALERETRGVDFKGNVRYFCPKCNVSANESFETKVEERSFERVLEFLAPFSCVTSVNVC